MSSSPELFPVFLKLGNRAALLVGGGTVAASKLQPLLAAGARVTVVAPEIRPEIEQAPVTLVRRRFEPSDLDGVWFVVAASTKDVNREVTAAAERLHLFVNAVDDPPAANAYAGGVVRRAGVTMAISTGGDAPALAGLLREALELLLPDDLDRWLEEARAIRQRWLADRVPMAERRPLLLDALNRLYEARKAGLPPAGPPSPARVTGRIRRAGPEPRAKARLARNR